MRALGKNRHGWTGACAKSWLLLLACVLAIGLVQLESSFAKTVLHVEKPHLENFFKPRACIGAERSVTHELPSVYRQIYPEPASDSLLAPGRGPQPLAQSGEDLFVGTYSEVRTGNLRSGLNPTHTPHHSVQAAVSPASSRSAGVSINLRKDLHAQTRTFRRPVQPAPNLRTHLAHDVRDLRQILRQGGYDRATVNRQLQELIRQNKALGGMAK